MKTLKLVMIVMIVSFSMAAFASHDKSMIKNSSLDGPVKGGDDLKLTIGLYMSLDRAVVTPFLVEVMHQQLNRSMLDSQLAFYTVTVAYLNYRIQITGSYEGWKSFFDNNAIPANV